MASTWHKEISNKNLVYIGPSTIPTFGKQFSPVFWPRGYLTWCVIQYLKLKGVFLVEVMVPKRWVDQTQQLVGGWTFQPLWKILYSQNGLIFPNFRGVNKKIVELSPPRQFLELSILELPHLLRPGYLSPMIYGGFIPSPRWFFFGSDFWSVNRGCHWMGPQDSMIVEISPPIPCPWDVEDFFGSMNGWFLWFSYR